jgi:transposase
VNLPLCACHGGSGQKPQYGLMMVAHQCFTAVFLFLIYGSLFLSGFYYCLSVFLCAITNNSWILHHNNALAHTTLSVREFLANKQITVLEQPPYLPDLAPPMIFLLLKIKEILKGRNFGDIHDIRSNVTAALKAIPQNQFQYCFEVWTRRRHRSIAFQGEYFEGNHSVIQHRDGVRELYCQTMYS